MTVRAFSNEVVIIQGTSTAKTLQGMNKNYRTFQDLIFDQDQIDFDAIRVEGHHITFKRVEVRNGQRVDIDLLQNPHTVLDGTQPRSEQTENALDFKAGDTVLIKNNTLLGYTNNKMIVVQKGGRNITIEGNTISDGDRGIVMRREGGTDFIQLNNSIENNVIYDMVSYALKFDGVKDIIWMRLNTSQVGTPHRLIH